MRPRVVACLLAPIVAALVVPVASNASPPVVSSDNVDLLATIPLPGAISTAFATDRPVMYVNTTQGITTFDISNPGLPTPLGQLALPHFENEAMALGERPDGTKFVLVGIDVFAVSPTDPDNLVKPTPGLSREHLIIVDVTDPTAPAVRSRLDTTTSTHTVQCVGPACEYAYTSGAYDNGRFEVVDLRDLDNPVLVGIRRNVAGLGGGNHQWDVDDAGVLWGSGGSGLAAFDVSDPVNPVTLTSTNPAGSASPYNDFILHNSFRPHADAFTQARDETGRLVSGSPETASVFDGNVVLATEEDYDSPLCEGGEGTFSTWHVPYLDAAQYAEDNPALAANRGRMTPLDTWNTEILDTGMPTVAGAFCSAHYFTYHDSGFIAQAWYQQGTRILDVRNPRDIKQVGYFFTGASETWHTYWVPDYDNDGKQTGRQSRIVYTNDAARGIDVLRVVLPATPPQSTVALQAPVLDSWLGGVGGAGVKASAPSPVFGYACRLAGL